MIWSMFFSSWLIAASSSQNSSSSRSSCFLAVDDERGLAEMMVFTYSAVDHDGDGLTIITGDHGLCCGFLLCLALGPGACRCERERERERASECRM